MRYMITVAYVMLYSRTGEQLITVIKLPFYKDLRKLGIKDMTHLMFVQKENVPDYWQAGEGYIGTMWINTVSNVFGSQAEIYEAIVGKLKELALSCGVPAFYTFTLDLNDDDAEHYKAYKKE